jgi:hypothetical protein
MSRKNVTKVLWYILVQLSALNNTMPMVSVFRCQRFGRWLLASGCWTVARGLTPYMKLRLAGTVNRLNVEHRTSNIERPILMTLRFIDFKTNEPQPATSSPRRARGLSLSKAGESNFEE